MHTRHTRWGASRSMCCAVVLQVPTPSDERFQRETCEASQIHTRHTRCWGASRSMCCAVLRCAALCALLRSSFSSIFIDHVDLLTAATAACCSRCRVGRRLRCPVGCRSQSLDGSH